MTCFAKPLDIETIVSGLSGFCSNLATQELGIEIVAIDHPQITRIGQDVQSATAMVEKPLTRFHRLLPLPNEELT